MRSDMIVHTVEPLNAEPPRAVLGENDLTGADTFYVRNHGPIPDIQPDSWRLRIGGLVDRPLQLSLAALRGGFPPPEVVAALEGAGHRRGGLVEGRDIPGHAPAGPPSAGTTRRARG